MRQCRRMPRASLALALIVCAACGPNADAYAYLREAGCEHPCEPDAGRDAGSDAGDGGPPVIESEPLEDWDTTGAGELSGLFAVEVVIPAHAVIDLESRQIYRLRILQQGADARLRITPCVFALPSIPSVATLSLPPRLDDVLHTLAVDQQGAFLSAADPLHATITTPRATILLGAMLADPSMDPLPTMMMPAGELDQDMDGQPGVTIDADTVLCRNPEHIYAALRATVAMSATIDDLDRFSGTVDPTLDQSVLGVSNRCLNAAASLQIMLVPGAHFTAIRVGAAQDIDGNGNVSCGELAWYAAPLFGDFWAMQ